MLPKRKLSQDEVSLEIDLEKLFGKKVNDSSLRRAIGESLIEKIDKRTSGGMGVDGKGQEVELKSPYSEQYADSLEFKAFGKKKNKVNMKLTGSMLSSIDIIDQDAKKLKIGIDNEDAPKAYNHMVGDTVPRRPFLGLTSDDLDKVKSEFADEVGSPVTAKDIFERTNTNRLINILTGRKKNFSIEDQ